MLTIKKIKWKLIRTGELYDMRNAPFEEKLVLVEENNRTKSKIKMEIKNRRVMYSVLVFLV